MQTVIKGTKTIEEYKRVKATMEELAEKMSKAHQNACETWEHGEARKTWFDHSGNICIEYVDGEWWHYNEKGEWW